MILRLFEVNMGQTATRLGRSSFVVIDSSPSLQVERRTGARGGRRLSGGLEIGSSTCSWLTECRR